MSALRPVFGFFFVTGVALAIAYLNGAIGLGDIAFTSLFGFIAGYLVRQTEEPAP